MNTRQHILNKARGFYYVLMLLAVVIVSKIIYIQWIEGDQLRAKAKEVTFVMKRIEAARGNILAADQSYLAVSVPVYELHMDTRASGITDEVFTRDIDSLAAGLAKVLPGRGTKEWKRKLTRGRRDGQRYMFLGKNIPFSGAQYLKTLPIFRMGQNKGGIILSEYNRREKPLGDLAARTIGRPDGNSPGYGLEAHYNLELRGKEGLRLMEKLAGDVWRPAASENTMDPEDGVDIMTTIDPQIQEVAHEELARQLMLNQADHGCVIVMETSTGYIRAMANLKRGADGVCREEINYAVSESTEPGSTVKIMTLMALLEDGYIRLEDSIQTGNGELKIYNHTLTDSRIGGYGRISVQHALEVSSNVAMAKLVLQHYRSNPDQFVQHYKRLGLDLPSGVDLANEPRPLIKSSSDSTWSGLTLPMMSIGYEMRMTPLQILTVYNAIANNGRMMRPRLVSEWRRRGQVIQRFPPQVTQEKICSETTLAALRTALRGVVENGTATNLKGHEILIAGKTGTARVSKGAAGYGEKGNIEYRASFCGFFPADQPRYSCMVVVTNPATHGFYGNVVAGPVFRAVTDLVYSSSFDLNRHHYGDLRTGLAQRKPLARPTATADLLEVSRHLQLPLPALPKAPFVQPVFRSEEVKPLRTAENQMPNLMGMGARDAIYLLTTLGIHAETEGRGWVVAQFPPAGTQRPVLAKLTLKP